MRSSYQSVVKYFLEDMIHKPTNLAILCMLS